MSEYEKQVRDIAYRLWLQEGKPLGHAERHWTEAERIAAQTVKGDAEQGKRVNTDAAPVATELRQTSAEPTGTPRQRS
jgi:hypothetical protein